MNSARQCHDDSGRKTHGVKVPDQAQQAIRPQRLRSGRGHGQFVAEEFTRTASLP